ncbi:MAG: hypothetical protein J6A67_05430 [Clostridia bacterium]|nr:hypothetical protein [Clostridia bacterium]
MGCLFNILVLPFEFILEEIIGNWFVSMTWIVPKNIGGKFFRFFLKFLIAIEMIILALFFVIGIISAISPDLTVWDLCKLIFIPLGISIVQILVGAIVKFASNKDNSDT